MGNAVVHFEVAAADDRLLAAFYGDLFGWRLQDAPSGGYTMIDTCAGHGINGAIVKSQPGEAWSTFYVEVEDLQATLDKAKSLGGTIFRPVTDFGGTTTAMFKDPDGLPVGLVKSPAEASDVFASTPSHGSGDMLDWFEVIGSDTARTRHFYTELFDWTLDDAGFPDYAIVDTGYAVADAAPERGVLGGLGAGAGTCWSTIYVWVADLEQAFSRIEKLGGTRVLDSGVPELKVRARVARIGVVDEMKTGAFRDPAGNAFGIFEYNPPDEEE